MPNIVIHDESELIFIVRGQYRFCYADKSGMLSENDLCIIPYGMRSFLSVYGEGEIKRVTVRSINEEKGMIKLFPSESVLMSMFMCKEYVNVPSEFLLFNNKEKQLRLIRSVKRYIKITEDESIPAICKELELSVLLNNIVEQYTDSNEYVKQADKKNKLLRNIFTYMQQNCSTASLQNCAQAFGYNAEYIGKIVKQSTDETYIQVLTDIRMIKTMKLLSETDMSLDDIAVRVGLSGSRYITQVFKQNKGMTPLQYRKKVRMIRQSGE